MLVSDAMRRRLSILAAFALVALVTTAPDRMTTLVSAARQSKLPARIGDEEFWQSIVDWSEPNGYFRSDNLTSNELGFQKVLGDLAERTREGGAYLGVGPEQNFTYIAALHPEIAIIFDIRRGNMLVQLMYKALFELSRDRADFVSMLFSRPRPSGLTAQSTASELFASFGMSPPDETMYRRNLTAIQERLTRAHSFRLGDDDLDGLEHAYRAFYSRGFAVRVSPTYAELMTQTDSIGAQRSYLAAEASFAAVKALESKNLVIPIVGDFAGPKAIRSVGAYLKSHGTTVTAFYLSNVEQYLDQDDKWALFCRNVASLPLDPSSTFIRSVSGRGVGFGFGFLSSLGSIVAETRSCGAL